MIKLQRSVVVRTFDLEATVATGRERPELLAVARLAHDFQRPISGLDIGRELLGGLPEVVGWRVVERCVDIGLLVRTGPRGPATLSEGGAQALTSGQVLVPEEGAWRFYIVEDPLVMAPVVHCERLVLANAEDERKALRTAPRDGRGRPQRPASDTIPMPLRELFDRQVVASSIVDGHVFQIRQLPQGRRGVSGPGDGRLELHATWNPSQPASLQLRGQLATPADPRPQKRNDNNESRASDPQRIDRALGLPPKAASISYDELWIFLAGVASKIEPSEIRRAYQRSDGKRQLPASFEMLDDGARAMMRCDLQIAKPNCGEHLGTFANTTLTDVELVPRLDSDAQRWAEWMQQREIKDYVTPENLQAIAVAVLARFPFHRPRLRTHLELLAEARARPFERGARYLLAPYDLGLWR
jgi:hypothetical protein